MTLAILCSGQGGQHAGMFDLTAEAPQAAELFDHSAKLLGHDPRLWIRSAVAKDLFENRTAQVLCTLQSLSAAAALAEKLPQAICLAGYSVGEVAAWSIAGLISSHETLDLAVARAESMDAAIGDEEGMLFVRGLGRSAIERLCAHREAAIGIVNPKDAWVLGGRRAALEAIAAEALRQGATRVVPLNVTVAAHTYLLSNASPLFRRRLSEVQACRTTRGGRRLFSGIDGMPVLDSREGMDKLALQLSHPVQWAACLESCLEAGTRAFLELGPGDALARMVSGAYPGIQARSLEDFRSIQGVGDWISRISTDTR